MVIQIFTYLICRNNEILLWIMCSFFHSFNISHFHLFLKFIITLVPPPDELLLKIIDKPLLSSQVNGTVLYSRKFPRDAWENIKIK